MFPVSFPCGLLFDIYIYIYINYQNKKYIFIYKNYIKVIKKIYIYIYVYTKIKNKKTFTKNIYKKHKKKQTVIESLF